MYKLVISYCLLFLLFAFGSFFQSCSECGDEGTNLNLNDIYSQNRIISSIESLDGSEVQFYTFAMDTVSDSVLVPHDSLVVQLSLSFSNVAALKTSKPNAIFTGFNQLMACSPVTNFVDKIAKIEISSDQDFATEGDAGSDISSFFLQSTSSVLGTFKPVSEISSADDFTVLFFKLVSKPITSDKRTLTFKLTTTDNKVFSTVAEGLMIN